MREDEDVVEQTLEFERRRAMWQMWLASLEMSEALIVAKDVAKMLLYMGNSMEISELNRQLLMGNKHTAIPSPSTYAPHKPGDAA